MEQVELDQRLFDACVAPETEASELMKLLELGADPKAVDPATGRAAFQSMLPVEDVELLRLLLTKELDWGLPVTSRNRAAFRHQALALTPEHFGGPEHTGTWRYHDDDCLCMWGSGYCNRGGSVWNCCGSVTESSRCAGEGRKHHTAVSSRSGDKRCYCDECFPRSRLRPLFRALVDKAPDLDALGEGEEGSALIHDVCDQPAWLRILCKAGADVNLRTRDGTTALHIAAVNNDVAGVECLLKLGADIHSRDGIDATPLHRVLFNRSTPDMIRCARALVRAGSDLDADHGRGVTPRSLVLEATDPKLLRAVLNVKWSPAEKRARKKKAKQLREGIVELMKSGEELQLDQDREGWATVQWQDGQFTKRYYDRLSMDSAPDSEHGVGEDNALMAFLDDDSDQWNVEKLQRWLDDWRERFGEQAS